MAATGVLAGARPADAAAPSPVAPGSHIGNLYPLVRELADESPLALSFLHPQFRDLAAWKRQARARVLDRLFYSPAPVDPAPRLIRRRERDGYSEEYLTFQTTPHIRVPAFVLVPKDGKLPAPGIVALHDHGGFYLWGKEKLVKSEGEHPALAAFRQEAYGGKSTAIELVRRGYVVVVIDMFYWGERRMLLDDDPPSYRQRPAAMPESEVADFNRRSGQNEQLLARTLFTAGVSWPGILLWDDLRTVDYLASRPEVDSNRLGCVGLSVGGYRSFMLSALDERIKAAVDVGWMTSFAAQLERTIVHTVGFSFHIPGLYHDLDLPDLAALVAPRALLVINGSKDELFTPEGVKAAFAKIAECYKKAGTPDRQRCSLYDTPHEFNPRMQAEAWEWLGRWA